jgi:CDP-diacylglycerol--serine O-phosphatidyltransferase
MAVELADGEAPRRDRSRRRNRSGREPNDGRLTFGGVLPSLLTTGNLAAGFYAVIKAAQGDPLTASYMIFVAAIFDTLDGRAARYTNSESKFGAEYDSIADTVSFGVAPAVIAFFAGDFGELRWAGWVLAFIYTTCASLRLARFNVTSGRYRGRFDGLPSPMAAGMVVSTVWFFGFLRNDLGVDPNIPPIFPAIGLAIVGVAMVAPFPYRSFKDVNVRDGYRAIVGIVTLSVVLIIEPGVSFVVIGLAYLLSGPVEALWRVRTGGKLDLIDTAVAAMPGAAPHPKLSTEPTTESTTESTTEPSTEPSTELRPHPDPGSKT